ncbi:MAG: outer membrane protein assembly factor BamD, partial [Acidobacteriota bacterium]
RPDSKLGVADTYLGEGSSEALVLAIAEYKEFLSFYPTNPRADYAQLKLGVAHFRQMRAPQRDQTETQEAIKEFEIFISRYPKSAFMSECQGQLRIARNRLGDANYQVGYFYFRQRWYPGAVDRFKELLKNDPAYGGRDAVYFYLGESLLKEKRQVEALPYYERLVDEFHESEHLAAARKRISELKAAPPTAS